MQRPITSKLWLVGVSSLRSSFRPETSRWPRSRRRSVWRRWRQWPGAGYAGAERCQTCHKAESGEFNKTHHAAIKPAQKDSVTGCEMCHGPGKAHADGEEASQGDDAKTAAASKLIFSFHGNPKQNAERCLVCHQSSRDQKDFDALDAIFSTASIAIAATPCIWWKPDETRKAERLGTAQGNFFNVPKLPEENRWLHNSQLVKPQPELCYRCHGNIQAQFALPTHHRVPEGAMNCSDCHNPHGTSNRAELVRRRIGDLHPVPRRKARTVCLRASGIEDRRLRRLPHAARQHQSHAAGPPRGALSVPAMPRESHRG